MNLGESGLTARARALAILLAIAVVSLPALAYSQSRDSADDKAEARTEAQVLVDEGFRLLQAGDRSGALVLFRQAYELYPSEKILLNIGTVLLELGRRAEAAQVYRAYVDGAGDRRDRVAVELGRLEAKVARLRIEVNEADAVILLDGRRVGASAGDSSFLVYAEPGRRTLSAAKPGLPPANAEILAKAGREHEVRLVLREKTPERDSNKVTIGVTDRGEEGLTRPAPAPEADNAPRRGLLVGGLATAGAGLIALGVGVYFGLEARSLQRDIDRHEGPWTDEDLRRFDDGDRAETAMMILTGTGAAALVVGGALTWFGWRANADDPVDGSDTAIEIAIHPLASGSMLVIGGSF